MKTKLPAPERTKCRKKFLRFFPVGFKDPKYYAWERGYKWEAHLAWQEALNKKAYQQLLKKEAYEEIARKAVNIETRTNLLFSFEKMALRDAMKSPAGAKAFAEGLYQFLYGGGTLRKRFEAYAAMLDLLPRKQTRVRTWPLLTVFGFIALPEQHIFLKPKVTKAAAANYRFDLHYSSKPTWNVYESLLKFADEVRADLGDLEPRDMIDIQSFIWVLGSDEYL